VAVDDSGAGDAVYSRFAILQSSTFLLIDTTQECYAPGSWHAAATYAIAIPSLVVFVFGLPLSLGLYLRANKHRFGTPDFEARFGFAYAGLRHKRWWWFFISLVRTSVLACIGLLVRNAAHQNLVAQGWLIAYLILTVYMEPYVFRSIVNMEFLAVLCILLLLYVNMYRIVVRGAGGERLGPLHSLLDSG
jgi:hypothetical protein